MYNIKLKYFINVTYSECLYAYTDFIFYECVKNTCLSRKNSIESFVAHNDFPMKFK